MAQVDASIPLGFNPTTPAPNLNSLLPLIEFSQKKKKQNALNQILSAPGATGPDGFPTAQAIQQITRIDPQTGMELAVKGQEFQMNSQKAKTERAKAFQPILEEQRDKISNLLTDRMKANGGDIAKAVEMTRSDYQDALKQMRAQGVDKDIVDSYPKDLTPANAQSFIASSVSPEKKADLAEKEKTEGLAERKETELERKDDATIAALNKKTDAPVVPKGMELLEDNKGTVYRASADGNVMQKKTADGKWEDVDTIPPNVTKVGASKGMPRSPAAMYIQKYMEEHPDATAEDISKQAGKYKVEQSESGAVGARAGAADVASQEVTVFAKQALDASSALKRSDYAAVNSALQNWDMKTNNPELRQLMIAADALVNARARAISPTGSPHVNDQLEGRKMLSSAFAKGDFQAGVDQIQKEAEGVRSSTQTSKDELNADKKKPDDTADKPKRFKYDADGNLVPQ